MNDLNWLKKIHFLFKKPKVIIVTGEGRKSTKEAIVTVLKPKFKIGKEIIIKETSLEKKGEREEILFLIKNSSLPILVVTHVGDIPPEKNFFAGDLEKVIEIKKIAKLLPHFGFLILNFDDETVREIKDETNLNELTFGIQKLADFVATDIKLNFGINFKVNYKGSIVPFWLERTFGKEQIYSALAAIAVGSVLDLNLVEISQNLKNYTPLAGKMRLIEGIKNSWVLDDSESATVFSMIEALLVLGKINWAKRKIAVLGDIIGVGKYSIEAHENIGKIASKNTDLLFTFGLRAKFIAESALKSGLKKEKIFYFPTIKDGVEILKKEIKEGDLILVDGSKEMRMSEIVEEIKKIG